MNCIEARRMVTPFVNKELSDKETEQFLKHILECSDCREELDIYYTMYKALDTLESGTHQELDFQKMLENEIRAAHHGIIRRRSVRAARTVLMFVAEILLIVSFYTGIEMKHGETKQSTFQNAIHRLMAGPERAEEALRQKVPEKDLK